MIIAIKELCEVDYIHESDEDNYEPVLAIRTVHYESDKDTLLEAFQEYDSDEFDIDHVIYCNDEFAGQCLDTIKYLSVEEIGGLES